MIIVLKPDTNEKDVKEGYYNFGSEYLPAIK